MITWFLNVLFPLVTITALNKMFPYECIFCCNGSFLVAFCYLSFTLQLGPISENRVNKISNTLFRNEQGFKESLVMQQWFSQLIYREWLDKAEKGKFFNYENNVTSHDIIRIITLLLYKLAIKRKTEKYSLYYMG